MDFCDEYQVDMTTGQAYALSQNLRMPLEQWRAYALDQLTQAESRKKLLQFSDVANLRTCLAGDACITQFFAPDTNGRLLVFQLSPLTVGSQQALLSVSVSSEAADAEFASAASEEAAENSGHNESTNATMAQSPEEEKAVQAALGRNDAQQPAGDVPLASVSASGSRAETPANPGKAEMEVLDSSHEVSAMIQPPYAQAYPLELEYELDLADIQKKVKTSRLLTLLGTFILTVICFIVLYANASWFRNYLSFYVPQETVAPTSTDSVETSRAHVEHDPVYIPFEQEEVLNMQVLHTGTPRLNDSSSTYNSLECTLTVTKTMSPSDFETDYASDYDLSGTEACVVFSLSYSDVSEDTDALASIIPQDALEISMVGANGETVEEYQLSNKAVGGSYNVSLAEGKTKTFYKRFKASDDIRYLRVQYYVDGEVYYAYFALYQGDTKVTYASLEKGDKGSLVTALQEKLVDLGYLDNVNASFGSSTKAAVELAQQANNLSQTGIADDTLLHLLLDTST